MTAYNSSLLKLFDERGYIHQVTDAAALDALAGKEIIGAYVGYDATAPSLHVGNLVSIMLLRGLQQAGHKPIVAERPKSGTHPARTRAASYSRPSKSIPTSPASGECLGVC